mgnify:CR=1 FL=1
MTTKKTPGFELYKAQDPQHKGEFYQRKVRDAKQK